MTLRIAFYKGTRPGFAALYSIGVRLVDRGPYSHCELVFSDGMSASASFIDGGVRFKQIEFNPDHWDIFEIADPSGMREQLARAWFVAHDGAKYDLLGNLRFLSNLVPDDAERYFCSEACAAALGYHDAFRFGPNGLAALLKP